MAEHFSAEIPRDGVLRAERKLKSPLVKRTNVRCLGALHALADNRTLLFRLLNSILFSLFGANWSDLGQRAELVPDFPVSRLFIAIKSDQRRRIILGAGDRE
jgi:hypothetical protein